MPTACDSKHTTVFRKKYRNTEQFLKIVKRNVPRFDPKQQRTGGLAGTSAENDGPQVPAPQLHLGVTQEPPGESLYVLGAPHRECIDIEKNTGTIPPNSLKSAPISCLLW